MKTIRSGGLSVGRTMLMKRQRVRGFAHSKHGAAVDLAHRSWLQSVSVEDSDNALQRLWRKLMRQR